MSYVKYKNILKASSGCSNNNQSNPFNGIEHYLSDHHNKSIPIYNNLFETNEQIRSNYQSCSKNIENYESKQEDQRGSCCCNSIIKSSNNSSFNPQKRRNNQRNTPKYKKTVTWNI